MVFALQVETELENTVQPLLEKMQSLYDGGLKTFVVPINDKFTVVDTHLLAPPSFRGREKLYQQRIKGPPGRWRPRRSRKTSEYIWHRNWCQEKRLKTASKIF